MNALKAIGWFLVLRLSIWFVFETVGFRTMVRMFPEGWRWWQLPLQLVALVLFAIVVLHHPFGE